MIFFHSNLQHFNTKLKCSNEFFIEQETSIKSFFFVYANDDTKKGTITLWLIYKWLWESAAGIKLTTMKSFFLIKIMKMSFSFFTCQSCALISNSDKLLFFTMNRKRIRKFRTFFLSLSLGSMNSKFLKVFRFYPYNQTIKGADTIQKKEKKNHSSSQNWSNLCEEIMRIHS